MNLNMQRHIDQIGEFKTKTSGVVKSTIFKNKFTNLLDVVTEEEPQKYDDNCLDKKFVDVTQIIEDKSDYIENSPVTNLNKNKKFPQDSWEALSENQSEEDRDPYELEYSPLERPGFTLIIGKNKKKKMKLAS